MLQIKNQRRLSEMETPFWYYDMDLFRKTVDEAMRISHESGILIHYSIKANSELRLLDYIRDKGMGVDCVSGNEVRFAVEHGFDPAKIVFAGVGKKDDELLYAMQVGISSFNCESVEELEIIEQLAKEHGYTANVSLRVNPDVDAKTHKFITTGLETDKFGIPKRELPRVLGVLKNSRNIVFKGLHFHVGSQITEVEDVFTNACASANETVAFMESNGLKVSNIDLGGGLGIDYHNPDGHSVPDFDLWFKTIKDNLNLRPDQVVHVEPGRSIVAQCCSLVARAIIVKEGEKKTFVIVDTGFNDLLRPALYQAYHKIENLSSTSPKLKVYDIAGPICESTDIFAEDRTLKETKRGDFIAFRSAGAYGSVMSSHYNMRTPAYPVFSDDM